MCALIEHACTMGPKFPRNTGDIGTGLPLNQLLFKSLRGQEVFIVFCIPFFHLIIQFSPPPKFSLAPPSSCQDPVQISLPTQILPNSLSWAKYHFC